MPDFNYLFRGTYKKQQIIPNLICKNTMKFCKKYQEYMQTQDQKKLPAVGFKNLKKILKRCRTDTILSQNSRRSQSPSPLNDSPHGSSAICPHHCAGTIYYAFFYKCFAIVCEMSILIDSAFKPKAADDAFYFHHHILLSLS